MKEEGRYQIIEGGGYIFKIDTATGKTWAFASQENADGKEIHLWVAIPEGKV